MKSVRPVGSVPAAAVVRPVILSPFSIRFRRIALAVAFGFVVLQVAVLAGCFSRFAQIACLMASLWE